MAGEVLWFRARVRYQPSFLSDKILRPTTSWKDVIDEHNMLSYVTESFTSCCIGC